MARRRADMSSESTPARKVSNVATHAALPPLSDPPHGSVLVFVREYVRDVSKDSSKNEEQQTSKVEPWWRRSHAKWRRVAGMQRIGYLRAMLLQSLGTKSPPEGASTVNRWPSLPTMTLPSSAPGGVREG